MPTISFVVSVFESKTVGPDDLKMVPDGFWLQNAPKTVFGRGSAPEPAGGAYDAPQTP